MLALPTPQRVHWGRLGNGERGWWVWFCVPDAEGSGRSLRVIWSEQR